MPARSNTWLWIHHICTRRENISSYHLARVWQIHSSLMHVCRRQVNQNLGRYFNPGGDTITYHNATPVLATQNIELLQASVVVLCLFCSIECQELVKYTFCGSQGLVCTIERRTVRNL